MEFPYREFDPEALQRLDKLCASADAGIVVSSSWRSGRDLPGLRDLFADVVSYWELDLSIVDRICGATEILKRTRGEEVDAWCSQHGVETHVILDDQKDFAASQPLVWIDPTWGLIDANVEHAATFLSPGADNTSPLTR